MGTLCLSDSHAKISLDNGKETLEVRMVGRPKEVLCWTYEGIAKKECLTKFSNLIRATVKEWCEGLP